MVDDARETSPFAPVVRRARLATEPRGTRLDLSKRTPTRSFRKVLFVTSVRAFFYDCTSFDREMRTALPDGMIRVGR